MQPAGLIIGAREDVRVQRFNEALTHAGYPKAKVIGYPEWIDTHPKIRDYAMRKADWLRIESPGRDPFARQAIRSLNNPSEPEDRLRHRSPTSTATASAPRTSPRGLIHAPDQFAAGFNGFLRLMDDQDSSGARSRFLNHPAQIMLACNKPHAAARMNDFGIPTPALLTDSIGGEHGYDAVLDAMKATGRSRVFIKLKHGSAGSGVVAYQRSATRELAITTVAMQRTPEGARLYNTRKIQRYTESQDIRALLDALAPMGVYVEAWFPKAGANQRVADLRVITIAGQVKHMALRLSKHPITNLHLLNERADPSLLRQRMQPGDWDALITTCELTAELFHRMLYLGIDLAVHAGLKRHTVLEVNAFGDLLHGVMHQGQDTYAAEVAAIPAWRTSNA